MGQQYAFQETYDPFDSPRTSRRGLLQAAARHRALVLLGLLAGLSLGLLYFTQAKPVFQSKADLWLVKKQPNVLPISGGNAQVARMEDDTSSHVEIMKSQKIVASAVEKHRLASLSSFEGRADVTQAIISSLAVSRGSRDPSRTNDILNISFRGPVADDCPVVVNAVIDAYQDFLAKASSSGVEEALKLITRARNIVHEDLAKKNAEYREFLKESPLMWKGKDWTNYHQQRLVSIEAQRSNLLLREAEQQARLTEIEKALREGVNREELLSRIHEFIAKKKQREGEDAGEQLKALELQEGVLLDDFGPNHPQVKAVRQKIAHLREMAVQKKPDNDKKNVDPIQAYLQSLRHEIADLQATEKGLQKLFEYEEAEAKKLAVFERHGEALLRDIALLQQLYDNKVLSLKDVNLVKDAGGYNCQTITPAAQGRKVAPNPLLVFPLGGLLGLLTGLGLVFVIDRADESFQSSEEVGHRLGLPVVGHIPLLGTAAVEKNGAGALDARLFSFHQPQSREAEAYRAIRTALLYGPHRKGQRVIQITSPQRDDGKTTLAANLAVSLAQAGQKVILLDADFRRPRLHSVFVVSNQLGMADVLASRGELKDALQAGAVSGLTILPAGSAPAQPAELLTSFRLKELLEYLRENYDFILVDTPPLLEVTDAAVVAPHVDGVLLTIRLAKNRPMDAERAREILTNLGASLLGIVLNGLDIDRFGYGYGAPRAMDRLYQNQGIDASS